MLLLLVVVARQTKDALNQTARTQLTADRDSNSTTSHCTAVTPTRAALHAREPPRRPLASVLQSTPCSENVHLLVIMPPLYRGWWRGTVVERRSLTGELSLSCARPAADG